MNSVSDPVLFLFENVRTEAGEVVETLVNTEAMRDVAVAVPEVSTAWKRRPVPMPLKPTAVRDVDVPVWERMATSETLLVAESERECVA